MNKNINFKKNTHDTDQQDSTQETNNVENSVYYPQTYVHSRIMNNISDNASSLHSTLNPNSFQKNITENLHKTQYNSCHNSITNSTSEDNSPICLQNYIQSQDTEKVDSVPKSFVNITRNPSSSNSLSQTYINDLNPPFDVLSISSEDQANFYHDKSSNVSVLNLHNQPQCCSTPASCISFFRTRSPLNGGTNRSYSSKKYRPPSSMHEFSDSIRNNPLEVLNEEDYKDDSNLSTAHNLFSHMDSSSPDNIKLINTGLKWYKEASDRGCPRYLKFDRNNRKLISEGLKDLFLSEIIPLIKKYNPDNLGDSDLNIKWQTFEGAYEECLHRIRKPIAIKLNLDPSRIYSQKKKKKWFNVQQEEIINIQTRIKRLKTLSSDIKLVNSLDSSINPKSIDQVLKTRLINKSR